MFCLIYWMAFSGLALIILSRASINNQIYLVKIEESFTSSTFVGLQFLFLRPTLAMRYIFLYLSRSRNFILEGLRHSLL